MLTRRALALSAIALAIAIARDTQAGPAFRPIGDGISRPAPLPAVTPAPEPERPLMPAALPSQTPAPAPIYTSDTITLSSAISSRTPAPEELPGNNTTETVTLSQVIEMTLRDNIDIQWHKTDLRLQDDQVRVAWGDFDPAFEFSTSYTYDRTPQNPTTITTADTAQQILLEQEALAEINGTVTGEPTPVPLPSNRAAATPTPGIAVNTAPYIFQNEDFDNSVDLAGKLPIGTTYKLGADVNHLNDTVVGLNQNFLPSNVFFAGLSIDQPLLRDFGYDANLVSVRIGRRNRQVGLNNWHQQVIESVGQVMATYCDMTYAQEVMQLRQESMQADRMLAEANQRRVNVGLMTPLDVSQAEVEVSADQDDLLTAKNYLTGRVSDLKKLIYRGVEQDDGRTFVTAGPVVLHIPVLDREDLLQDAYQNRLDYSTAIQQSEIEDIRLKYYKNQLLPKIDAVATLGVNGLSTQSTGSSISSAIGGQGPEWVLGLQGSIPLGDVAGRANLASSRKLKEEAIWKLKQVELTINTDVDTAISAIRTNQERVRTALQAQKLAEEVVRAQNRRLEEGQASTIDVIDNRRRLYDAQSSELEAVDDLNKSIIQLYLATGTILREESIIPVDDEPDAPGHHRAH